MRPLTFLWIFKPVTHHSHYNLDLLHRTSPVTLPPPSGAPPSLILASLPNHLYYLYTHRIGFFPLLRFSGAWHFPFWWVHQYVHDDFFFFFLILWPHFWSVEVLWPGIEAASQLRPTLWLLDPLTHCTRPRLKPTVTWATVVVFLTHCAMAGTSSWLLLMLPC